MPKRPMSDVIVLLPGITGSVLRKGDRDVWSMTLGAAANALFTLGRSITDLELRDDDSDDGVTAPQVMPDLHLIPGLWKIDGYAKVSRYILDNFEVTPQRNFFQFPYDWRRDNRIAARRLKDMAEGWLHEWRRVSPEAKLIVIGHSMGGLVSRYFLECLDGWRHTRMLITFGTPYRGSLNALNFLVHGMKKTLGPITLLDLSSLLRSFTSVYQLLPIYPCFDPGDGALIRVAEATGIPSVDAGRAKAADEFHREIESAVTAHLDDEEYLRNRYSVHPIVGTFQPTILSARRSGNAVEFLRAYPGEEPDGDGTVPRVSATPIELPHEEGAMFAAERHASLQNNDGVLVQLAGLLSQRDTSRVRGPAGSLVALDIDDAFGPEESISFRVQSQDPTAHLQAVLTNATTEAEVARLDLGIVEDWRTAEFPAPMPGSYRLTVSGRGLIQPVSDAILVFGPEEPQADARKPGRTVRGFDQLGQQRGGVREGAEADLAAAASEPALEQRYLNAEFPERVRMGDRVGLLVSIGVLAAAERSAALKPISIPQGGVDMLLILSAPGFTSASPDQVILHVLPGTESDPAVFQLEATKPGVHDLKVTAFLGGTYMGVLHVQSTVDTGIDTSPATTRAASIGGREKDAGELSLLIDYDAAQAVYRYRLIDWSGGAYEEVSSDRLLKTPAEAVEALVAQLNSIARGKSPMDVVTTKAWLEGQGMELWNSFIPDALQREFWARRDRITRMSIVSKGDPVPWELLYPTPPGGGPGGFLVEQFPVSRWTYNSIPPSRVQLSAAGLVLSGQESLESAPEEMQAVAQLLSVKNVPTTEIKDWAPLEQLLDSGDFGLLHFTCHNTFSADTPNSSYVTLGGSPFTPVMLNKYAGRFREASPMVFMNACRTDGQAPLYTRIEGWSPKFLDAGVGAFIGSLWEVVDSSASTYAQEFYAAALGGDSLGEATRKARDAIKEEPGDPTWLAYALYGDPAATVV